MSHVLALDTWAGRRYHPVEVVGETPKKMRVKILSPDGVTLPGRRFAAYGDVVLVPKHAVREATVVTEAAWCCNPRPWGD